MSHFYNHAWTQLIKMKAWLMFHKNIAKWSQCLISLTIIVSLKFMSRVWLCRVMNVCVCVPWGRLHSDGFLPMDLWTHLDTGSVYRIKSALKKYFSLPPFFMYETVVSHIRQVSFYKTLTSPHMPVQHASVPPGGGAWFSIFPVNH